MYSAEQIINSENYLIIQYIFNNRNSRYRGVGWKVKWNKKNGDTESPSDANGRPTVIGLKPDLSGSLDYTVLSRDRNMRWKVRLTPLSTGVKINFLKNKRLESQLSLSTYKLFLVNFIVMFF